MEDPFKIDLIKIPEPEPEDFSKDSRDSRVQTKPLKQVASGRKELPP